MSNQAMGKCELVSALADGQLDAAGLGSAMDMLAADADARAAWRAYHVAGDVLRAAELSEHAGDSGFVARFQARLAAQGPVERAVLEVPVALAPARSGVDSANESQFRWKLTAGLASVVALAALSWSALGPQLGASQAPATLAQAGALGNPAAVQTVAVAGPGRQVMIRDPRLDQLLAAHKQFGGTSALQMPAGFLRNATYEEPSR
jgi:sigma-E factor negative regulatory protein RseA